MFFVNWKFGMSTKLKTNKSKNLPKSKTKLIDEICNGTWINPLNNKRYPPAPFDNIIISDSLKGWTARLVESIGLSSTFAIVCDENTYTALGKRIEQELSRVGLTHLIVLTNPHANEATVRDLTKKIESYNGIVAVGTGTINDITKHASFKNNQKYCVFATAGSMNGYTSSTASITLDSGLKVSLPSQAPIGFFVDLEVCASAPAWLNAAGFGDCICRSVAQIDWWMSHRLLNTMYMHEPYLIEISEEQNLLKQAAGIASGDLEAITTLIRLLTLCGLGVAFTGVSNHGSMGEHQISHYIDCFAGKQHPGSLHGQQVGVTSLTMARLQHMYLEQEKPPEVKPTRIDSASMSTRMGSEIATQCEIEYRKKAFDQEGADRFNKKLQKIWPELRRECLDMAISPETLKGYLEATGGPTTAEALKLPVKFYQEAVCHAHEMRNRFSFTDIACDAGDLKNFATKEL